AGDEEGHGRCEPEQRPGADRHERLPEELERDDICTSRRGVVKRGHVRDPRIRERGRVELGCLDCFLVEPEMWPDLLHACLLSRPPRSACLPRFHGPTAQPVTPCGPVTRPCPVLRCRPSPS